MDGVCAKARIVLQSYKTYFHLKFKQRQLKVIRTNSFRAPSTVSYTFSMVFFNILPFGEAATLDFVPEKNKTILLPVILYVFVKYSFGFNVRKRDSNNI